MVHIGELWYWEDCRFLVFALHLPQVLIYSVTEYNNLKLKLLKVVWIICHNSIFTYLNCPCIKICFMKPISHINKNQLPWESSIFEIYQLAKKEHFIMFLHIQHAFLYYMEKYSALKADCGSKALVQGTREAVEAGRAGLEEKPTCLHSCHPEDCLQKWGSSFQATAVQICWGFRAQKPQQPGQRFLEFNTEHT